MIQLKSFFSLSLSLKMNIAFSLNIILGFMWTSFIVILWCSEMNDLNILVPQNKEHQMSWGWVNEDRKFHVWTIPSRACIEEVTSIKLFWLHFAVSVFGGVPRSRVGRAACPAGRARPHSWLWIAYTSCTGPGATRQRSASHATGGRGRVTGHALLVDYCGGTSCTGGRPRRPSL